MCGIAGWYLKTDRAPDPSVLKAMTDAIAHRGPDGEGQLVLQSPDGSRRGGLGHRRLSIIDLATGDQPMHYTAPDGRQLSIVFNGEVYNFRELRAELEALGHTFRTTSDTEVVLAAQAEWGPQSVERLRGMFAHIIWEHDSGRMTVVRDRFGKKPVFMADRPEGVYFASEIKALLAVPGIEARLNLGAVPHYLNFRYVPGPLTFFDGIVKLPPASVAVCENGKVEIRRYWTTPDSRVSPEPLTGDPVSRFMDVLHQSVELRMIADVPFGAFLSGGIDSSAIVALMSQISTVPVNTFSVGFAEGAYSELGYAKEIADQFGTNHHELEVSADTLMDWLPGLIGFRDAPVAEPSDIPIYLLSEEARRSVKMVLTGEGSDELIAGYPKHRAERYAARYHALVPGFAHTGLIRPLVAALPYSFRRIKTLFDSLSERDIRDRYPRWFGVLGPAARDRLLAQAIEAAPFDTTPFEAPADVGTLRRLQHFDQTSWLPDNLLERGDRMTMAASIEGRMPFMDHVLAETVSKLPDDCRIRGGEDKWVLREGMRRILPEKILNRPKVGFRVPVNEWFRTTMRDWVRDHLTGADSRSAPLYDRGELARILDEHASGRQNQEKLIWTLISFELFLRRYGLNP
ncbi:MAG: asparagine synthase (glutamine-hydrolyzing) [Minwuia sp.]|uniref:asparagine synthase (glutamine-hydrolyzing) n=1 Tax=Minwuia sp. TaxID=2493630 RepID=UPI003A882319